MHDSIVSGETDAEFAFVFCSREHGETEQTDIFLKMVENYRIPLVTFSYQKYKARVTDSSRDSSEAWPSWRLDYDREVMDRLRGFQPALCVLDAPRSDIRSIPLSPCDRATSGCEPGVGLLNHACEPAQTFRALCDG